MKIQDRDDLVINGPFTSLVQVFRNLAYLNVDIYCSSWVSGDQCGFQANNNDVTGLAAALPQLTVLTLGHPCSSNTCATTVACLLPISVHCAKLEKLEVHFNTTNITADFESAFQDPKFQDLHKLPRSPLQLLNVHKTPLTLKQPDRPAVVTGLAYAFPSLMHVKGDWGVWDELSEVLNL